MKREGGSKEGSEREKEKRREGKGKGSEREKKGKVREGTKGSEANGGNVGQLTDLHFLQPPQISRYPMSGQHKRISHHLRLGACEAADDGLYDLREFGFRCYLTFRKLQKYHYQ